MTLVVTAGNTATAAIDGLSAAGATPALRHHTPAADLELVAYGRVVRAPVVPVSPSGCPTPALVTRAVRDLVDLELFGVDAGLSAPTAAPTVDLDAEPGGDVRDPEPVPAAADVVERARGVGQSIQTERLHVSETIPGGTTTALGVLTVLGEPHGVSSSLPENPLDRKRSVVEDGLAASGLTPGDLAGSPVEAVRTMGDPVLAAVLGLARGALASGVPVTLAGGTQLVAAAALLRHAGVEEPLSLATTPYVARDPSADLESAARGLDLELTTTDPGFDAADHPAMDAFERGEAKEGVGMGGALAVAEAAGVGMDEVRARLAERYAEVVEGGP